MKRCYVVCEGQTEEEFVNNVLRDHFLPGLFVVPRNLNGVSGYGRVANMIKEHLKQDQGAWVTTMLDFFRLPSSFPGYEEARNIPGVARVEQLELALKEQIAKGDQLLSKLIGQGRFVPYIQRHEFEALLFSKPEVIAEVLERPDTFTALQDIRSAFSTPEDINGDPTTAPSKRLDDLYGRAYNKPQEGTLISLEIGLEDIRRVCPHFNAWITKLETL